VLEITSGPGAHVQLVDLCAARPPGIDRLTARGSTEPQVQVTYSPHMAFDYEAFGDRARHLMDLIEGAWQMPYSLPPGVAVRLATVVDPNDVVWADADLRPVEVGKLSGRICLISERRIILASVRHEGDSGSNVSVETWSRSTLSSAGIAPSSGEEWDSLPSNGWPVGAQALLIYAERAEPLVLPLSPDTNRNVRKGFAELFPSLLGDLDR
jgi:hypothetical protein